MKSLGRIVRLQIQRQPLKRGAEPHRVYDPSPILEVQELTLTRTGACARAADGSFIVDIHNSAHPQTRNNGGVNPLSVLFTSHYAAMRRHFGDHLVAGCAGESILVECDRIILLGEVAGGITIRTRQGEVKLRDIVVATPCKPFSAYALASPPANPAELKPALQYLDHGMRGFYCRLADDVVTTIAVGDEAQA